MLIRLNTIGGLSHLSNQYGFAADNVVSFEVVLANASATTASAILNADLFFALRGGSNNYGTRARRFVPLSAFHRRLTNGTVGIVTHATMRTYPIGKVWGGVVAYNNTYVDALMRAFAMYQKSGQLDTKSAIIADMVFTQNINLVTFVYLAPVRHPVAFSPFYNIPSLYDQTKFHDTFSDLIGPPLSTGIPR